MDPPKNLGENKLWRSFVRTRGDVSPRRREYYLERAKHDLLFWVNTFVEQYNPNAIGEGSLETGPFLTWDFQDEAFGVIQECMKQKKDLVIVKSREMGASWMCLLAMAHPYLFFPYRKYLMISRNAEAVDRAGDSDSLFWKLDFVFDRLPGWMVDGRVDRRKMGYYNPRTSGAITGQASTGAAGVGGRAHAMFIDEFSLIREDYEVLHHTANTTGCRIFNGTHRGTGTAFAELAGRVDYRKLVLHWTQHPDKRRGLYRYHAASNTTHILDKAYSFPPDYPFVREEKPTGGPFPCLRSPYYDEQCIKQASPRAIAMNLDIDAQGSVSQLFNPVTVRVLTETFCTPPLWEGDISYDKDRGKPLGLVKVDGGPLKLWCYPKDGYLPVDHYGGGCDISTGVGSTNSVLSIANRKGEKVLEYAICTLPPESFAPVVAAISWLGKNEYGEPTKLCWEHAGPGAAFGRVVADLGYPNIYCREPSGRIMPGFKSDMMGFYPSPAEKDLLLEEYRAAVEHRHFINRSKEALEECLDYRYNEQSHIECPHDLPSNNDPTGARLNHGDRVIADALCWRMVKLLGGPPTRKVEEKVEPHPGSLAYRRIMHKEEQRRLAVL